MDTQHEQLSLLPDVQPLDDINIIGTSIDVQRLVDAKQVETPQPFIVTTGFEQLDAQIEQAKQRKALEAQAREERAAKRAAIRNNATAEVNGILAEVAREHGQGLARHGGEELDDEHAPMEWYGLASLQLARGFLAAEFKPRLFRQALVRTAALLIAAIRWVDRNCGEVD